MANHIGLKFRTVVDTERSIIRPCYRRRESSCVVENEAAISALYIFMRRSSSDDSSRDVG